MSHNYIAEEFDINDVDFVSAIDEVALWSVPFGLKLLDLVILKPEINVLDIGCGSGFPAIELAQRLGSSVKVYGIDSWDKAIERAKRKMEIYNVKNVELIIGNAENLQFEDDFFDLIVSNNGINNVEDIKKVLNECNRTSKVNSQFVFSMNLEDTMKEFYEIYKRVLSENNLKEESEQVNQHIFERRKPVDIMELYLKESGYAVKNIQYDKFFLSYLDGTTMFRHFFIRLGFMKSWKEIIKPENQNDILIKLENALNEYSELTGQIKLTIPYAVFDCRKI
jgi:ubiquinone/menaquinone biosynthesis C-methylase UbiE